MLTISNKLFMIYKSHTLHLQNLYNSLKQALQKKFIINLVRKTNTIRQTKFLGGIKQ